jgi:L-arabinokinase
LFPEAVEAIPGPGWPLDVGVVQHDGLDFDIDATRERWRAFAADFDEHASQECALLREAGADILVGDIPPLAFAGSERAGLPSIALGNFTWDWIYANWPGFDDIIACVQRGYRCAERLLRLPMHAADADAFAAFRQVEDVPLIARHATRPRDDVRRALRLPLDRRVVLVSFGGFSTRGVQLQRLAAWADYTFVFIGADTERPLPANVVNLNESPSDYVSLLAACDAVVTKPGYGIVADCLANRVAVLFTDRGPFREYDVLAETLTKLARARYVPRQDVLAGELGPHLDALLESHTRWVGLPMNGATVVAERVLGRVTIEQTLLSR